MSSSAVSLSSRIAGLRPEVWLCVGAGFAREDVKSLILSEGKGFVAEAIVTLPELCLRLTGISSDRLLARGSRQEILRMLLAEPKILEKMPEIKRLKRQRNWITRIDEAIQLGRMSFAHAEEERVYEERLFQSLKRVSNPLRAELRALTQAYEAWMQALNWVDLPLLLQAAIRTLREGWPAEIAPPREVCSLTVQTPESLEREFWDALGIHVTVQFLDSFHPLRREQEPSRKLDSDLGSVQSPAIEWQIWHTLDDAAEFLADQIASRMRQGSSELPSNARSKPWQVLLPHEMAVLIPDQPSVRRSLKRALEARKIPLAEPRDPTQLRWDENLKWALMPLEVVASQFERQKVISYLRSGELKPEFADWVIEINSRGIKTGLRAYSGGVLSELHRRLEALDQELGGKKTAAEFAQVHLNLLKQTGYVTGNRLWIISFFEALWKTLADDLERVEIGEKKAPLLFWLEKLSSRIRESSPPVEKLKPTHGISLYRLQQAPVCPVKQIWILGLPAEGLSGEGIGDDWFTAREREILSTEFAVKSSSQVSEERLKVLQVWLSLAQQSVFLDSHYDEGGRERESILPILKQLEVSLDRSLPGEAQWMGCHPRFEASFNANRPIQPQILQLEPLFGNSRRSKGNSSPSEAQSSGQCGSSGGLQGQSGDESPKEITATAIDRYSRCSFQALGYHRWNLKEVREPDSELWPDVRGNLLHEAVRILLRCADGDGNFKISPREALDRAWNLRHPKGLIRNVRVEAYIKNRMTSVLEMFCEKEQVYRKRSGAQPVALETLNLRLNYSEFSIVGQPDRVDEHPDGYFVLDYKTSGTLAHGIDMVELGYRLQLPFYAVALKKKMGRPVLGVQFVELDKRGGRKNGIFFKKYNGKEPGCLTQVRPNSKSLIPLPEGVADLGKSASRRGKAKTSLQTPEQTPEQATEESWEVLEGHLTREAQAFLSGTFEAKPKLPKRESECALCRVSDLCGYRRLSNV